MMKADEFSERLWGFAADLAVFIETLPDTRVGRHVVGQLLRSGRPKQKILVRTPEKRTLRRVWHGRITACLLVLVWSGAGCRTSSKSEPELETVVLDADLRIAPPASLEPEPMVPGVPPLLDSERLPQDWPRQWTQGWVPLESLCRFLKARLSRLVTAGADPEYRIESSDRTPLDVRIGSRMASWGGVQFWLAYGPRLFQDKPYIHALDARKNLLPLLRGTLAPFGGRRVVIDPGHGGRDLGAQSVDGTIREKDLVLDWALRLGQRLQAKGWQVLLTRTNDVELGLAERVATADQFQADLFISLHFNSAYPATDRTGIETYCLTPLGLPSTLVRFGDDDLNRILPNNAFDEQNLLLAFQVHGTLLERTGAADRGIRRARFMTVLQGQKRPAILIEGGFLSTESELNKLVSPNYRQLLAEAIAAGLDG